MAPGSPSRIFAEPVEPTPPEDEWTPPLTRGCLADAAGKLTQGGTSPIFGPALLQVVGIYRPPEWPDGHRPIFVGLSDGTDKAEAMMDKALEDKWLRGSIELNVGDPISIQAYAVGSDLRKGWLYVYDREGPQGEAPIRLIAPPRASAQARPVVRVSGRPPVQVVGRPQELATPTTKTSVPNSASPSAPPSPPATCDEAQEANLLALERAVEYDRLRQHDEFTNVHSRNLLQGPPLHWSEPTPVPLAMVREEEERLLEAGFSAETSASDGSQGPARLWTPGQVRFCPREQMQRTERFGPPAGGYFPCWPEFYNLSAVGEWSSIAVPGRFHGVMASFFAPADWHSISLPAAAIPQSSWDHRQPHGPPVSPPPRTVSTAPRTPDSPPQPPPSPPPGPPGEITAVEESPAPLQVTAPHEVAEPSPAVAETPIAEARAQQAADGVGAIASASFDSPSPLPPLRPEARQGRAGAITAAPPSGPGHSAAHVHELPRVALPMPADAATARLLAMEELTESLINDTSKYAILPGQPERLREAMGESLSAILDGIPFGTLKADDGAVRWAARFCTEFDTPFMRPLEPTPHEMPRERELYAQFIMYCAKHMKPRAKSAAGADGRTITQAKPPSALGPLYGWRRVLRDTGHSLPDTRSIRPRLKGLVARFKKEWGARALIPKRKKPFSQPMLQAMARDLRERKVYSVTNRGTGRRQWSSLQCDNMAVAFKYGLSTGERAEAIGRVDPADEDFYRRANFVFVRNGVEMLMTPENMASVRDGDFLRGRSVGAKCDRDNMHWGDRDMWFRVNSNDPLNFAAAWRDHELQHPVPLDRRGTAAAFSPYGSEEPFTRDVLQNRFDELVVSAIGAESAAGRSWHSLRATAATALHACKRPDGHIQCVIRWKTLEAMRLYAKMQDTHYADLVDEITTTNVNVTHAPGELPITGPDDVLEEMEDIDRWLDGDDESLRADPSGGKRQASSRQDAGSGGPRTSAAPPAAGKSHGKAKAEVSKQEPQAKAEPTKVDMNGETVRVRTDDTHSLVGRTLLIPNSLWPKGEGDEWDPDGHTPCRVIGECVAPYAFSGGNSRPAYIIECEGEMYPVKKDWLIKQSERQSAARKRKSPAGIDA